MNAPENLLDALVELENILSIEDKIFMLLNDEDDAAAQLHHSLGRTLRNNWGLWDENSSFHKWFLGLGIFHADDMSGIIITTYYRRLNCLPICLCEQIEYYKEYWETESKVER